MKKTILLSAALLTLSSLANAQEAPSMLDQYKVVKNPGSAYITLGAAVRNDDTLFMLGLGYQFYKDALYLAIELDFVGKSDDSCSSIVYSDFYTYRSNSCSNFGITGRVGMDLGIMDAYGIFGYSTSSDDALNDLKGFRYGAGIKAKFEGSKFFIGAEYIYQEYEDNRVYIQSFPFTKPEPNHNRYNIFIGYKF